MKRILFTLCLSVAAAAAKKEIDEMNENLPKANKGAFIEEQIHYFTDPGNVEDLILFLTNSTDLSINDYPKSRHTARSIKSVLSTIFSKINGICKTIVKGEEVILSFQEFLANPENVETLKRKFTEMLQTLGLKKAPNLEESTTTSTS